MSVTTIPIVDEQQWLAERAKDVTSTESAALYGLSPYLTEFELWHQKRDNFVEAWEPNKRVVWGKRLQDAIAFGVAEDRKWHARRLDVYMRDERDRIGSSFDFEVVCGKRGRGLMEIKNVDALVFRDDWIDGPSGIEAPQHIELQVQHEMEVADAPWCALVALVGGNDAKVVIRERDREIGQHIRGKVRAFWRSVESGVPPKPDYTRDADFLCRMHGKANAGEVVEADHETAELLARYASLGEMIATRDAIKARILERIGTASRVRTPFGTLSCGEVRRNEGVLITPDMVGTRIGARDGYRLFRFTKTKNQ